MTIKPVGPGTPTQPSSVATTQTLPTVEVPPEMAALKGAPDPAQIIINGDDESFQDLIKDASREELKGYLDIATSDMNQHWALFNQFKDQLKDPDMPPEMRSDLESAKRTEADALERAGKRCGAILVLLPPDDSVTANLPSVGGKLP